mmetsp:Transcript_29377/g.94767  ORF Transcript_29377/g.94767 Transcript_29377/m.94767 type:complete len:236 (+) Transcript_29377:137-844(+)
MSAAHRRTWILCGSEKAGWSLWCGRCPQVTPWWRRRSKKCQAPGMRSSKATRATHFGCCRRKATTVSRRGSKRWRPPGKRQSAQSTRSALGRFSVVPQGRGMTWQRGQLRFARARHDGRSVKVTRRAPRVSAQRPTKPVPQPSSTTSRPAGGSRSKNFARTTPASQTDELVPLARYSSATATSFSAMASRNDRTPPSTCSRKPGVHDRRGGLAFLSTLASSPKSDVSRRRGSIIV